MHRWVGVMVYENRSIHVASWVGKHMMVHRPVLLVEDDLEVLESTADLLEDMGYVTHRASSGHEALRLLDEGLRPGLLLVDYEMPDMSGEEFLSRCVARPKLARVPCVFLSGRNEPSGLLARSHAMAFLTKPLDERELGEVLDRAFRRANVAVTHH